MNRSHTCLSLLVALCCRGCSQEKAAPVAVQQGDENSPALLEIAFRPFSGLLSYQDADSGELSCGVPAGRQQAYDPKTGVFHVQFKSRNFRASAFEVTKVAERFTKPVVFRLTGDTRGGGCLGRDLTLSVDGKDYALEEGPLSYGHQDGSRQAPRC